MGYGTEEGSPPRGRDHSLHWGALQCQHWAGIIPALARLEKQGWGEEGHPREPLQGGPRYPVSQGRLFQSGAAYEQAEAEAVHLANEMQAEYWSVSAKTGE